MLEFLIPQASSYMKRQDDIINSSINDGEKQNLNRNLMQVEMLELKIVGNKDILS